MNKKMQEELSRPYEPKNTEDKIYKLWEKSGVFNPDKLKQTTKNSQQTTKNLKFKTKPYTLYPKPFSIIMPPPNANGSLHIGHAVFVALQDIMIRYHRMKGEKTLWLPGADHAGFETQVVYDKKLEKEGRSRFQIPKDELYKEMLDFTLKNKKIMEGQLRKLGASCDWSREKFTMDKDIIKIVYSTFEKLYEDGLVYRGLRIINWCVKHQTALSDLEVRREEKEDSLYYIKYGPLVVATVRPETKFGDIALAVNPKDKRYQKYIGKEIEAIGLLETLKFKVIADEAVDQNFGTGVVKITPAHDSADFEIWQRHKDEIPGPKTVIDEFGRLTLETGPYAGLKISEAREKVAEDLKKIGILEKVEKYKHNVAVCYKCDKTLEPLLKPQWFIKMTEKPRFRNDSCLRRGFDGQVGRQKNSGISLKDLAVRAVKNGEVKFIPKHFEKIFFHWLKNLRDWNISRQIPWGIKIPAWYCEEMQNLKCKTQNGIIVAMETPKQCPYCGSLKIKQDPDVFDTWFSSGQWPFATLLSSGRSNTKCKMQNAKFRKNIFNFTTADFKEFYPTAVMETAHDILFFWVARMIMLGIYATGKPPFKYVYLHGLVRDKDRQKMSKSRGNVIDPLGVIDLYGADALRMALIVGNTPGNDVVISEDKIRGYRNFANKIWNAARFALEAQNEKAQITNHKSQTNSKFKIQNLTEKDKKWLKELEKLTKEITKLMDNFKFYAAGEKLYHYFWHAFADKIIEESKSRLRSENEKDREAAQFILLENLTILLKLLHPFMPFITEKIWPLLPKKDKKRLLIIEAWPK